MSQLSGIDFSISIIQSFHCGQLSTSFEYCRLDPFIFFSIHVSESVSFSIEGAGSRPHRAMMGASVLPSLRLAICILAHSLIVSKSTRQLRRDIRAFEVHAMCKLGMCLAHSTTSVQVFSLNWWNLVSNTGYGLESQYHAHGSCNCGAVYRTGCAVLSVDKLLV